MSDTLAQTPLYEWHAAHGGRLVDFAGWSMPVQYSSIVAEHHATRRAATLFDVSHMGRLTFTGTGAEAFLDRLLTRKVAGLLPGQVRYSLLTNDEGNILDDVLVYHIPASRARGIHFQLVVNASNRERALAWIEQQRRSGEDWQLEDQTFKTAMISLQGPLSLDILRQATGHDGSSMKYYTVQPTELLGAPGLLSRTGYTGEDGFEWTVPAQFAVEAWNKLLTVGLPKGVIPAGLGARDTLRLEAAMPLYGHELSESINPYQAGLGFAVNLKERQFPGHAALTKIAAEPLPMVRVGLELTGKRPVREGAAVVAENREIGQVTSGTFSPTLERPIAMAYVPPAFAEPETALEVDIRGRREGAKVVKLPFYCRSQ